MTSDLLLWSSEQAEHERQGADILAAKLRELGVDPNAAATPVVDIA